MNLIKFSTRPAIPWFGDVDRWFDAAFAPVCKPAGQPVQRPATGRFVPAVDIAEDDKKIVVRADLPGVEEKDVEVKVEDNTLTLSGERKYEKETEEENLHRVERAHGSFLRSFTLPDTVDAEKIGAKYDKGVLEITIPKVEVEQKKARVIDIH